MGSVDACGERCRCFPRHICSEQYREDTKAVDAPSLRICDLDSEASSCSRVFSFASVGMHISRSHIQFHQFNVFSALQGFFHELLVVLLSLCMEARSSVPSQLSVRVLTPHRSSSRVVTGTSEIIESQRKSPPVICLLLN